MRWTLTTELPVLRFSAAAEMAWLERRAELAALCLAAQQAGGLLGEPLVAEKLALAPAGARNVVRYCRGLGLCDAQGHLSPAGVACAASGEAPVPEQGSYTFWGVEHPLLGQRLLHAERISTREQQRDATLQPLPLLQARERVFPSVIDQGVRFTLRRTPGEPPLCLPAATVDAVVLTWDLDFARERQRFQLSGALRLGKERQPIVHEPEETAVDLWALAGEVLALQSGRWDAERRRFSPRLQELTEEEQESFEKDYALGALDLQRAGAFQKVMLARVPLQPLDAQEAQRWAEARLQRRLRRDGLRFRLPAELQALFDELVTNTPLARHRPALPGYRALLKTFHNEPSVFWSLAAPLDLAGAVP